MAHLFASIITKAWAFGEDKGRAFMGYGNVNIIRIPLRVGPKHAPR